MATIKELKEEMEFSAELIDLLETMKNTAVFQFHALQARKARYELFFKAIKGFFQLIGDRGRRHPLMMPGSGRDAIIMVTSDEGFMGSLNFQVVNATSLQARFEESELVMIGVRGARYLADMGRESVLFKGAADAAERRSLAVMLEEYIIKGIKEERFGRVFVAYPKPISFMLQRVEIVKIMPFLDETDFANKPKDAQELIIESPLDGLIDYLTGEMLRQKFIDILEESKLSEFAARAMHLENSSQQLEEKKKKLKLQYFKAYHEIVDRSTRELFSAQVMIHGKR